MVLKTYIGRYDLQTANGSTSTTESQRLYIALNSTLVSASVQLATASQGPVDVDGLFLFDVSTSDGFYLPGTYGTLRADSNYTSSDMVAWTGSVPTSSTKAYVFAAVRNDTGSTVTVQVIASVDRT